MNTSQKSDIGIIGLSVMGRSLALNMADHGFKVSGYNRSASVTEQVMEDHPHENLFPFYSLDEFVNSLEHPRKVMLMIQAGAPVDAVIDQLIPLLEQGDIFDQSLDLYPGGTHALHQLDPLAGLCIVVSYPAFITGNRGN